MVPGEWFAIELDDEYLVSKVVLDTEGSRDDYPRAFTVTLSRDGRSWTDPVASGTGRALLEVSFEPRRARHIRIEQGGRAEGNYWSIHEIEVHGVPLPGARWNASPPAGASSNRTFRRATSWWRAIRSPISAAHLTAAGT
jgi:hypothetical protein